MAFITILSKIYVFWPTPNDFLHQHLTKIIFSVGFLMKDQFFSHGKKNVEKLSGFNLSIHWLCINNSLMFDKLEYFYIVICKHLCVLWFCDLFLFIALINPDR